MADTEKKWYVIHTFTGHEEKVMSSIMKAMSFNEKLKEKIEDMKIPTEDIMEVKKNKKKISKRKYFPGYIIAKMVIDNDTYWVVRNTPGVTGFLGDKKPISLQEEEVSNIMFLAEQGATAKPKPSVTFEKDENVRIIEGPFENFIGVVEKVDEEKNKVRVMVTIFGRSTPVELDFNQVEKT
jgi:transcriptional antiterminator NusG